MPAVSGRDDDRVDVVAFQDAGHVVVGNTICVPVMLVGLAFDRVSPLFLWIGNRDELTVLLLEETGEDLLTSSSEPDTAQNNSVAWSDDSIFTERTGRNNGGHADGGNGGCLDEGTAGVLCVHVVTHFQEFARLGLSQRHGMVLAIYRDCRLHPGNFYIASARLRI